MSKQLLIRNEDTHNATLLKKELIKELCNKQIKYIDVIQYYYDIKKLNDE